MRRFITLMVLGVLLVSIGILASAEPMKIQYKFTANEIDKYKMTMTMRVEAPGIPGGANGMNMSMSLVFHQKTLGILPDGSAKVLITYKDFSISAPGGQSVPKDQIVGKTVTMIMGRDGQIINVLQDQLSQSMGMGNMMSQMGLYNAFPKEPVEVGQSWVKAIPIPMMGGNMSITSTLLTDNESLWSRKTCKIKQAYEAKIDLGEMLRGMVGAFIGNNAEARNVISGMDGEINLAGWGMSYFCPEMGKLLKADGSIAMNMTMTMPPQAVQQGAPQQLNINMNMDIDVSRFK